MASICLAAGDKYVQVKIDENDLYTGVLKLLKSIRPNWTQENIKLKVFIFYVYTNCLYIFIFMNINIYFGIFNGLKITLIKKGTKNEPHIF